VREHLATFEFFLEAVLVKSLEFFDVSRYVILRLRLRSWRTFFDHFFRWWTSRIS